MEKALSNSSLRQLKPLKQVSPACSSFLRPLTTAICHDKDLGYVRQWHLTKVGFHPSPHLRVRKMKPRIEVQTISQFHQAHKSVVTAHLPVGIDIGRGPTQKVEVWGMKTGHRLSIQFDDRGQLVGDNSSRQTSFLDTLVRGDNITLVAVPDQRYIDNIAEQRAWKQINIVDAFLHLRLHSGNQNRRLPMNLFKLVPMISWHTCLDRLDMGGYEGWGLEPHLQKLVCSKPFLPTT